MVDNEDNGGVPLLFFMCSLTILVIVSCITFVSYGIKSREQEMLDFYARPITKEEVDEAYIKYANRLAESKIQKDERLHIVKESIRETEIKLIREGLENQRKLDEYINSRWIQLRKELNGEITSPYWKEKFIRGYIDK